MFLDLAVIGGLNGFNASRKIEFGVASPGFINRKAHTRHHGWDLDAHLDGGGIIDQWKFMEIRPFISFDYLLIHEDGFHEHGADSLNLHVQKTTDTMLRSEAGINLSRCFRIKHGYWIPEVRFSVVRENRFNGHTYRSNFQQQPGSFFVKALYPTRTLFSPGAGITWGFFEDKMNLSFYYDGEFGDGFKHQTGNVEFSWEF